MYALGKEKPSWDTVKLRAQMYAIMSVLRNQNKDKMNELEQKLGIMLPTNEKFQPKAPAVKAARPDGRQRAMTKRQCASCGQMARSNCQYKCCKSCCIQLKNPCTIHVLVEEREFVGKAYGASTNSNTAEPLSAFTLIPDAQNQPRLRDLKESIDAFHEETTEVTKWRTELMHASDKANEECAIAALERYQSNAKLLAEVVSTESLEGILLGPSKKRACLEGEDPWDEKVLQERLKGLNDETSSSCPSAAADEAKKDAAADANPNVPSKAAMPFSQVLKRIGASKNVHEINHYLKTGHINTDGLDIKAYGEWLNTPVASKFDILASNEVPQPPKQRAIDLGDIRAKRGETS
eukprot:CAMPEP_0198236906 /NCGR_PEP_ID=MMETSP1446-20131203/2801_1 /TAXON_ID=1461542 ORGANISM="Unidentified sp, Strain CCMP2111" /NCGR_SAMPLE_ID=MMETSP1446 /ASSEMBLY_ACC=CAM_ASM_001112 /LENGTH=350 /DNA_ID=CAMNT_0043918883 /DNA_START=252 /DNA_END=1304 /DNA_ORIENTATION=+